ncbi:hypothetical protein Asulf_01517 [Archaeoglobus sulfaticallidus PM70-1]|uniref:Uncharacterized protein n=1 Tax=Archaeoglobus sulfaticallidus PM70-1 TaxID=387631 RepID=N0BMM9_9EURY|nr:hypothetical protein [Archaeoglobus sulfaticallidus]AGK61500.1 hypothetical protein Asulf_01517 [Archaeoglobus sulfaticallidus PM70-1]
MISEDWARLIEDMLKELRQQNEEQTKMLLSLSSDIKSIHKKLNSHCDTLEDHEKRLKKVEKVQVRHSTYFKIMGAISGFIATIATLFAAIKSFFQ